MTELRRGVLGPCVLALLEQRPRFGLELVRDLAKSDGLLKSEGTVYPLLNRLRDSGLVTSHWETGNGERARRYYSITPAGERNLAAFRAEWAQFSATVGSVLYLNRPASFPERTGIDDNGNTSEPSADPRLPAGSGRRVRRAAT